MKKYLDNKKGMAMPMVLIIMVILTLFATALALYANSSLKSVRWMSDEKKAYYLAQAGVEAANQAYQNLLAVERDPNGAVGFEDEEKAAAIALVQESETKDASGKKTKVLTTAPVYLAYNDSDGTNAGTLWEGLHFTQTNPGEAAIGTFTVEIGNGKDTVITGTDSNGNKIESEIDVKVYRSVATVGSISREVYAYITPAEFATETQLYNEDGVLNKVTDAIKESSTAGTPKTYTDPAVTNGFDKVTVDRFDPQRVSEIQGGGIGNFFKRLANGIIMIIFNAIFGDKYERPYATYLKTSEGNLVLTKPANADVISCNENEDNFYVFGTAKNLFLQNTGIDATPTKGYYAAIGLYGQDIVVDDDITMYAYIPKRNLGGLPIDFFTTLISTFGNRYRLGTVVIGNGSKLAPSKLDSRTGNEGGLKIESISSNEKLPVNRVFFNGNVYLKVEEQGSGVETFRVFESGDIAYFYGMYNLNDSSSESVYEGKEIAGIDLTKFFIDAVIAHADGYNNYSDRTIQKLRRVKELYYGGDDANYESYVTSNNVLIRKLGITYESTGLAVVDGGKGTLDDLIQPTTTGNNGDIIWGRPKGGDVFANS